MKRLIAIILTVIITAVNVNAQKLFYSDDNIEAQLIELKGDLSNYKVHPVVKIRAKTDASSIFLIRPQTWSQFGYMFENTEHTGRYDYIMNRPVWRVNIDKDVWVKTNFDEYFGFQIGGKWDTASVLRIDYSLNGWEQWYAWNYLDGAMTFYDVPIKWEMPEIPTSLSKKYGVEPLEGYFAGLYHFYGEHRGGFDGIIRLEAVVGDLNSGQIIFLMQVKPNNATSIYAGDITLKYKGELLTYKGKSYSGGGLDYKLVPGQWNEIAVIGIKDNPVLFYPDINTKLIEYLEIQMGNSAGETRSFVAQPVPIQWISRPKQK